MPASFGLNFPTLTYVATVSTVGGITSSLQGGRFGSGFKMAGLSSVLGGAVGTSTVGRQLGGAGQFVAKAAVAGTLTSISGRKFANGAMTAAFTAIVSDAFDRGFYTSGSDETDRKLAYGLSDPEFKDADGYKLVSDEDAAGFGLPSARISHEKSGFRAGLFVNERTGDHVMVFGGTDVFSWADWRTNIAQAFGFRTDQYDLAMDYGKSVSKALGGNLRFAGHSLGGGLASAAANVTGRSATTFNAAGLHSNTVSRYVGSSSTGAGLIRAYHSSFDLLSIGQRITPLPMAAGDRIPLGRAGLHGMGGLCRVGNGC